VKATRSAVALSIVGAAVLVASLLVASLGLAGNRHVLLIGPSPTHATVVRVRQELELLGLEVEVVMPAPGADLAALARDHGAAAVARVEDWPPEIVLWVDASQTSGASPSASPEMRVSESLSGAIEPGLLALRAVELLRGRLLPVPLSQADGGTDAAPEAAPTPSLAAGVAPVATAASLPTAAPSSEPLRSAPRLPPTSGRLHLGPALLMSPGGVPVAPALRVGGAWRVAGPVELGGFAMVPLTAGTVTAAEGQIELRVLAFGAGVNVLFTNPAAPLALHAGGGLGVAAFFFEGQAAPPWVSASGSQWSAMPFVEAGVGYRFTPMLGARADLLAALARPEPVLVIAGREVASFGSPALFASVAVEVHP